MDREGCGYLYIYRNVKTWVRFTTPGLDDDADDDDGPSKCAND